MAANQVGALKQIFILKRPGPDGQTFHQVFINPRITWKSETEMTAPERCLSFPGLVKSIRRARRITVEARDIRFQPFTLNADDLLARIIQHEIDHLHGVVIADD